MSGTKTDMLEGPLFKNLIMFAVPVMFTNMLQLLFNTINTIVVGQFCGDNSLAAIGSTTSLINLLTNMFIGLSIGSNIMIARYYGAKDRKSLQETVDNTILLAALSGILLVIIGTTVTEPILRLMNTPEELIGLTALYLRIYFCAMPAIMAYNFGSAIMRGLGDTKRPLYYLMISGVCNIVFNLIFITIFNMDVAGAGLATVLSEYISAAFILHALFQRNDNYILRLKNIRPDAKVMTKILSVGLPTGIQNSLFSFTNVLIQSSVNSFGALAVAGCSAAGSVDAFIDAAMLGISTAGMNFVSQNLGAKKYDRINKILIYSCIDVTVIALIMGLGVCAGGRWLLGIYCTSAEAVSYGLIKINVICLFDFICGIMDVINGFLRGLGYAAVPMIICLVCVCSIRLIWIFGVFRLRRTLYCLFFSYPVTWIITIAVLLIYYRLIRKNIN